MLSEEITKFIGQTYDTSIFEVEKESIRRFADAVGDANPLYWDAKYAGKSRYGSIIAPPGFISSLWFWGRPAKQSKQEPAPVTSGLFSLIDNLSQAGYRYTLDSGIDYEFFHPVRAGNTIRSKSVIKDLVERGGKEGKAVFLITETTYTNQKNEIVAIARATYIQH
jgi:acyl dehydratase